MTKQCNVCRGTKKVLGMGWIEQDCKACDGSGRIDIPDKPKIEAKQEERKHK